MPIRRYVSLVMGVVTACLLIGSVLVSYGVIRPNFLQLETDEALRDNVRAVNAVSGELDQLQTLVDDWAVWDASYRFMSGRDASDYVASNLTPQAFRILEVDFIVFLAGGGNVVWSGGLDPLSGEMIVGAGDEIRAIHRAICPPTDKCMPARGSGLVDLSGRVAFVATAPVLTSLGRGPANGMIAFARTLNEPKARGIAARAQVQARVLPLPPQAAAAEGPRPPNGAGPTDVEKRSGMTRVRSLLAGLTASQAFHVVTESPRRISALGDRIAASALVASIGVLVVVGAVATWLIESRVVTPAHRLARKVSAARGERSSLPDPDVNEFNLIDTEFDRTLSALRESEKKMIELNYYAGMAEMFSGMAHNLRNTLMPMSLNVWRLRGLVARHDRGAGTGTDADAGSREADRREVESTLDLLEAQIMDVDQTLQDHHVFSRYGRHLIPTCVGSVVEDAVKVFMG
ncbi:CHASE4 domain-containing protein, partial [Arenibaculum sp.]|uniref:CHASE4 domain-containing protein n=1 Tax=Arenibaculum sp. TaxID=2865862 RepID=UPI002E13BB82|nr:CHASE4 domain-containing protein [Arenibaculum sp.]